MTPTDLIKTVEAFRLIQALGIIKNDDRIGIHSGIKEQIEAASVVFQEAHINLFSIKDWDIMHGEYNEHDLFCFFNVFHYIPDPFKAFTNVLNSCKYLLIQDLVIRDRGENIFGQDGDCMRYEMNGLKSNYRNAFNLGIYRNRILFFSPYLENKINVHFIALIKGIPDDIAD